MQYQTKKLTTLAMLAALAYLVVVFLRIPIVPSAPFLKYEPKDVVIVIGGFLYGPVAAAMVSVAVSLVEMFTVSDTWIIGAVMNVISTCSFACTAAVIYKRKRTRKGAVLGLAAGVLCMCVLMLLWNYLIAPLYMGVPREVVAGMLLPVFLPFNLAKGGLNAVITMFAYKPVKKALLISGMLREPQKEIENNQ